MQPNYIPRTVAHARLRMLKDAKRLGNVSEACRLHKVTRKTFYKWKKRYDGTLESLMDQSRRPHSHPRQLTDEEHALIDRVARSKTYTDIHGKRRTMGLHRLHHHLCAHYGFTRSVGALYKALKRLGYYARAKPRRRRKYKRYERPYPGANIQIDIKYLEPIRGKREYQYTAIDEHSRIVHAEIYDEIAVCYTVQFLRNALDAFHKYGVRVEQVQTDHGTEFTFAAHPHIHAEHPFERELRRENIVHKLTPVGTPHLQGKVERVHRLHDDELHSRRRFRSSAQRKQAFRGYITYYNHRRPHGSLNWRAPIHHLNHWREHQQGVTHA